MNILITNDDGIFARGLRALVEAFSGAGHAVYVCAPDRERSCSSHSATLAATIYPRPVDFPGAIRAWAVDGTPVDCASLGLFLCTDAGIDMVVAGINRGMNLGGACVYSGTVGAALEAAMRGAQALAVSLCVGPIRGEDLSDYGPAARLALRVAEWMPAHPLPLGAIYNLNVPLGPYEQLKGLEAARLAPVFLHLPRFHVVEDENGTGYRTAEETSIPLDDPEYDLLKIMRGYATLTRLTWDFRMNADDGELGEIGL